jgi:AGCS family alanine or glycine:cation symporter
MGLAIRNSPRGVSVNSFKRFLFGILAVMAASSASVAQDGESRGAFIDFLVASIHALENFVFSTITVFGTEVEWIVIWMAAPMVILTFYFGFVNLRSFGIASKVVRGHYHDENAPGEVTQFQALTTALSGTVGLGNIAGVALAIAIGGPGATFWMIIIGFFAMTLKFAECTLGVKYREVREDGTVAGGPMYYLEKGLKAKGWGKLGKTLAWSYAGLAVIATIPQITQANQAYSQLSGVTGITGFSAELSFGIITAVLTGIVIIGGLRSIASVTSRLVPLMTLIYLGAAIVIIFGNISAVPEAFSSIISGAFAPQAVEGGILGVIVIGMRRAVYSTEAGLGSATMAHAAAKTNEPVSEGMVALMEPFIDTVIICTITALVIVITGAYTFTDASGQQLSDIQMTSAAFGSVISWFPYVLAIAVLMFAFSTIISWGYYAGKVWEFIFGGSNTSTMIFKLIFCIVLIPSGFFSAKEVYSLIDSLYFMMAIPNILGIYLLAPEIKHDIASYFARIKSGEIKETRGTAAAE